MHPNGTRSHCWVVKVPKAMCAKAVAQEVPKVVCQMFFVSFYKSVIMSHHNKHISFSFCLFFFLLDGYILVFQIMNGYDFVNGK